MFLLEDYAEGKISIGTQVAEFPRYSNKNPYLTNNNLTDAEEKEILWIRNNDEKVGPFDTMKYFLAELKS